MLSQRRLRITRYSANGRHFPVNDRGEANVPGPGLRAMSCHMLYV
jgi:hypothetical protein